MNQNQDVFTARLPNAIDVTVKTKRTKNNTATLVLAHKILLILHCYHHREDYPYDLTNNCS